jgi:NAD(P)H-flavin reductase
MALIDSRLIYTSIISHNDPNMDTVKYGFVINTLKENHDDLKNYRAYISGAPDMVKLVKKCLLNKNIDAGRLHYDNG